MRAIRRSIDFSQSSWIGHLALRVPLLAAVLAYSLIVPTVVFAQAWVPAAGETDVSLAYQSFDSPGHLNRLGQPIGGPTQSHTVVFEVEHGLTDKVALTVALPYIAAAYEGNGPACPLCVASPLEFHSSHLDDGKYHGTLQDFRLGLRYNIARKYLLLTPFVAAVIPSHHYENEGEAAVGRRFLEGQIGLNAGRDLGPFLPRAYVQGRYSYSFVPRDEGLHLNRSNALIDVEYSVTSALELRGVGTWQWTHGGLVGVADIFGQEMRGVPESTAGELLQHHDRLLQDNNFRAGAGALYSFGESLEVSLTVIRVVSGTNTHRGTGVTVGVTWTFSRKKQVLTSTDRRVFAHRAPMH